MAKYTAKSGIRAFLTRFLMGLAVGGAGVAPGLSGGVLLVVFGVYDRLAHLAAHPREAARQWRFCLPVLLGILLGAMTLGRVLALFFAAAPAAARCLFIGLLAGTLPHVWRSAARDGFYLRFFLFVALGAAAGGAFLFGVGLPNLREPTVPALLLCGAVLGIGTAVPGVSSSFILISMDAYGFVLAAIGGARPDFLPPLLLGFSVSLALTVKLVDALYRRFYGECSFAVLGFLVVSFLPVCPAIPSDRTGMEAIALGVLAAAVSLLFSGLLPKSGKVHSCVDKAA